MLVLPAQSPGAARAAGDRTWSDQPGCRGTAAVREDRRGRRLRPLCDAGHPGRRAGGKAGEAVLPSRISANHDDEVFTDPDVLDLARARNPHLAFGHGPHHCPGAHLARAELQIALGSLMSRFPTLRLAVEPKDVKWESGGLAREISALPVVW
ncbi:cytochrome P450 [Micromonospora sp. ALFpr18c]|nr:cytochrome P450 [Micromonospora sp. ALFpr18c]